MAFLTAGNDVFREILPTPGNGDDVVLNLRVVSPPEKGESLAAVSAELSGKIRACAKRLDLSHQSQP